MGRRIAIRLAGSKAPRLRVTLGAIYRAFPEARSSRVDDLAEVIRPMVERMDARQDARTEKVILKLIAQRLLPRIESLEKAAGLESGEEPHLHRPNRQDSTRYDRTRTQR